MKSSRESTALLLAFLIVLSGCIYLFIQNNKLKERIEKFIPAAVQLQNENELLKHTNEKLIQDLTPLKLMQDSMNMNGIKESVKRGMFNIDSFNQANTIQQGDRGANFNDLNKGIK